jgi:hypothetical protein
MDEHFRSVFNSSCRPDKSGQTSNLNNLNTSEISQTGYHTYFSQFHRRASSTSSSVSADILSAFISAVTCEARMMYGAGENWVEEMEGNSGSLPKWYEKTDFFTPVSDSLAVFPAQHIQPAGIILILR